MLMITSIHPIFKGMHLGPVSNSYVKLALLQKDLKDHAASCRAVGLRG